MSQQLIREELLAADEIGIHKLDEPLTGYKMVECVCQKKSMFGRFMQYFNFQQKERTEKTDGIATLNIPSGATVVRPSTYSFPSEDSPEEFIRVPSRSIRTDKMFVEKIEPTTKKIFSSLENCRCYSLRDENYEYKVGELHRPIEPLDEDIYKECTNGLYFVLTKEQSVNYQKN